MADTPIVVGTGSLSFDGTGVTGGPITGDQMGSGWGVGLAFEGYAPTINVNVQIGYGTGGIVLDSLAFTGYAPSVEITHIRGVGLGSLAITGYAPDPLISDKPEANTTTGSLAFTGYAPTLNYSWWITPTVGSLSFTGYAPKVIVGQTVYPTVGSLSVTGIAAVRINVANSGVSITNPNASTSVPSNYEQCDYTGFRQMPGSLKLTWNKYAVRRKSYESRHPQDVLRNVPERKKGSRRPEADDRFISDIGTVDAEDL